MQHRTNIEHGTAMRGGAAQHVLQARAGVAEAVVPDWDGAGGPCAAITHWLVGWVHARGKGGVLAAHEGDT